MKAKWTGERLSSLIHDTWAVFHRKYPGVKRGTYYGKRNYWLDKIKRGEINMPPTPEANHEKGFDDILRLHHMSPELMEEFTEKGYHVGYIKNSDGEIEYTLPLPHARGTANKHELSDFISQADPIRVTPSRRKPVTREHDVLVVFSDTQIGYMDIEGDGNLSPTHDERYINIVRQVCQDYRPEYIIDTSDTVDFANLSRFPADSNRFNVSLNPSINRAHRMYAELRADNPNSRIIAVDSNHTERLVKFMMKNAPELHGTRQAGSDSKYPALSYPFLMNFEALDVEWYGGYRGAQYVHGEEYDAPPIIFRHGESAVANGSTAAKESKEHPETHVVRGHSHRAELFHRTNRAGEYLTSMVIGCGCHTTGEVPSYHSSVDSNGIPNHYQENWQQSIGLIFDYRDGNYDFNHIMVNQGIGRYNGDVYEANIDDM